MDHRSLEESSARDKPARPASFAKLIVQGVVPVTGSREEG
jgi:hypothetical protein